MPGWFLIMNWEASPVRQILIFPIGCCYSRNFKLTISIWEQGKSDAGHLGSFDSIETNSGDIP